MLIDCPTCSRCYHVDPSDLGAGRMVICPRCQTRWYAGDGSHEASEAFRRGDLLRLIGIGDHLAPVAVTSSREPAPAPRRSPSLVSASVLAGLVGLAILLVGARERIVRFAPSAAPLYAAAGLRVHPPGLALVKTASARRDPASSDVIIAGEIRNEAKRRLAVPRLVYDIRDAGGASLVKWTESARAKAVPAGRVLAFASSPHHLPVESRSVLVTFEPDGDDVSSTR